MRNIERALQMKPGHVLCLQAMAEVQFRSGDLKKSFETSKAVIDIQPDGHAHVMAGIIAFKNAIYWNAMQYLKTALKYEAGNHPVVHQCLGESFIALGMLKDGIAALQDCLEIQPENSDALKAIGDAFKELGDDKLALQYVNSALKLDRRDLKALMIRGHVHFSSGRVHEAIEDYSTCYQLDPSQYGCQYMKALGLATIGRFYESVKESTQVMVSNQGSTFVPEYSQSFYLREFSRYLHSHLDTPLHEYRFDEDIADNLRETWVKNLPWSGKNYTEQPGIEPQINDVETINFKELSNDAKILLCRSSAFEELMQYHSDGFMPNWRTNKAMGLAVLDVAQTALMYWKSPVSLRSRKGKRFSWRDIYDVAIKWRKLVSMWYPVVWLDLFPRNVIESGLTNHILFSAQKLSQRAQEQIQKASDVKEFVTVLRKASPSLHAAFAVALQIPSTRRKSSQLDGALLTLSGQREDEMSFVLESVSKPARTNQFHSELEYLWGKLAEDVSKHRSSKESSSDINTVLTMLYYFYNFIPLSKGSSAVAYSVALGLLLAIGQEVTGPIPIGKQPDIEALLSGSPDAFIKGITPWLGLHRIPIQQIQSLPSVRDTFPTSRAVLEALNSVTEDEFCRKRVQGYVKRLP
eukprot:gene13228-4048_t